MKLNFYDESIKPLVCYMTQILFGYMENSNEDIFEFLCNRLSHSVEPTVNKIKKSLCFLSFYFSIANIGKSKVKIRREDVFEEMVKYRDVLKKFLRNDDLPESILENTIYSANLLEYERETLNSLPLLYDNNEKYLKRFQKHLNEVLIDSILNIAELLESVGVLKELHKSSCKKNKMHHLSKISIDMGEPQKMDFKDEFMKYFQEKKSVSCPKTVYELFSLEYLSTLNTEKLIFINLFWSNKLAKTFGGIMRILIFFQNNKSFLKGLKNSDIGVETLNFYSQNFDGKNLWNILKEAYVGGNVEDPYLLNDIKSMLILYEDFKITYVLKDLCIFSALETEGNDKSIKNYGIINNSDKGRIIYAWDIPKMNLPITVHIKCDTLMYYYTSINPQKKVREYIGHQDFFDMHNIWRNSLLYEISKEKAEYIKTKSVLNNQIKHILFLQTGIFPEHMRENGKVKKHFVSLDQIKR